MKTDKKTVLITGCSSGIGRCAAEGLRQRGYRVFASARKPADVDQLKNEGFDAIQLDLADAVSVQQAVEQVLDASGGQLYGLFNNAAYGLMGAVEDLSRDALRKQFETNVFGTHQLTNLIIPVMRKQGEGRIIQNSSVLGFVALPFCGAYTASKHALEGLTDTLRMELAGSGVYASLIEPGPIATRFRENAYPVTRSHINAEASVHKAKYATMERRMTQPNTPSSFSIGPEAVLKRVIHALESKRPKPRYYVTPPTYLLGFLKRILTTRGLERILSRVN